MSENFNNSVTLERLFNLINAAPEKNRQDLVNKAYEAIKPRIAEIIEEYKEFYVFFEQLKAFCISTGENYAVSMPNDIDFNKAKSHGEHDEALVEEEKTKAENGSPEIPSEGEKSEVDDTNPANKTEGNDEGQAKAEPHQDPEESKAEPSNDNDLEPDQTSKSENEPKKLTNEPDLNALSDLVKEYVVTNNCSIEEALERLSRTFSTKKTVA